MTSLGIDIEDYHPGETDDSEMRKKTEHLMNSALLQANVITAASPLILEHSTEALPRLKARQMVINNVFSLQVQPVFKTLPSSPLKLVWFSQTVGLNRGLQDCLRAISQVSNFSIQLTIIGDCAVAVKKELAGMVSPALHKINFLAPMTEELLLEECSRHHIGLAIEISSPLNRDICLTNKLFVYLLAGNAIVASQTTAQRKFFADYPEIGETYPNGSTDLLAEIFKTFQSYPDKLSAARAESYRLAQQKLNWEKESTKFADLYCLN